MLRRMNLAMNRQLELILILIALNGCSLIPKYERPAAPVSSQWPDAEDNKNSEGKTASDIGWREFFSDPRLQKLIELALANNRDLRIAVLNVEELQSQYRILQYALLPTFDISATGERQRDVLSDGRHLTTTKYKVTLNTAYEVDLFGRIRSLKKQVLEQYFATAETRRSAQITLMAQVAIQYLTERALDEQLAQLEHTLESVEAYYQLIKKSYELGNTSELDLRSVEAQVQTVRADITDYKRQRLQTENALVLLIGEPLPDDLPLPQPLGTQHLLSDLPAGIPSDLLERRPDILAAEHQLKAANANIGAVRAAFFPQITLTTTSGSASVQLAKLFTKGSEVWNFTPEILLPIFNQNTNAANLKVANVRKRIEITNYEKAIQTAFSEVADALAARSTFTEQLSAQDALTKTQEARYKLAGARYRNGVDSYLTVLTAQQDLYRAEQALIQVQFLRLSNLVNLYKALGGGWEEYSSAETTTNRGN